MKNSNRDAATAYHEAGHAVVSWCLGVRVGHASIIGDAVSAGHVQTKQEELSTCDAIARGDRWDCSRFIAEKRVMMAQAGEVAQRRYVSRPVSGSPFRDDRKKCAVLLRQYAPDERKRDIELHYLLMRRWTIHLIAQRWYLVKAVAKALLKHGELSGTQFLDVIDAANQKQTRINVAPLMDVVETIRQRRDG